VGEDVEIEILDSTPSQVKLGIRAPKSVSVVRKEIQVTRKQNVEAARAAEFSLVQHLVESLKTAKR
jgi:carbon storage regulator